MLSPRIVHPDAETIFTITPSNNRSPAGRKLYLPVKGGVLNLQVPFNYCALSKVVDVSGVKPVISSTTSCRKINKQPMDAFVLKMVNTAH